MATATEWSIGYARQAAADFMTFELLHGQNVPELPSASVPSDGM